MTTQEPITVEQGDDEVIDLGPILDADGVPYDTTGHVAELIIKASRYVADSSGTTITGSLVDAGATARFQVPATLLATAGIRWYRARVVSGTGKYLTIGYGVFRVLPV